MRPTRKNEGRKAYRPCSARKRHNTESPPLPAALRQNHCRQVAIPGDEEDDSSAVFLQDDLDPDLCRSEGLVRSDDCVVVFVINEGYSHERKSRQVV